MADSCSLIQCGAGRTECGGKPVDCGGCNADNGERCGSAGTPGVCTSACFSEFAYLCNESASPHLSFMAQWGTKGGCNEGTPYSRDLTDGGFDVRPEGRDGCIGVLIGGSSYWCCP